MTADLPAEWLPAPDGRYERSAVRVVLLDADDRLLLVRGHSTTQARESWWFTVGGGIDPDEDPLVAVQREAAEETGLCLTAEQVAGPLLSRTNEFEFFDVPVRQFEHYYLARVDAHAPSTSAAGWTELEQEFVDELRWWTLDELSTTAETVFPADLAQLTRGWLRG